MKERITWIDVAKFFGIFCIYLGHFHANAGRAYPFVFQFHVPRFFFLSGCTEHLGKERSFFAYLWHLVKTLLIPFYLFCLLAIVMHCIETGNSGTLFNSLSIVLKGNVRNAFYSEGLWFLSCLFVMKLLFYPLRKFLKFRILILAVCFALYWMTCKFLAPPQWIFNIDSALYYIVYYAIGFCVFPWLNALASLDTTAKKIGFGAGFALSLVYTGFLFYGENAFAFLNNVRVLSLLTPILTSLCVTFLVFVFSVFFKDIRLFVFLGENTLYLCGSEYLIKTLLANALGLLGFTLTFPNPFATYVYTFLLLFLCAYTFVPTEKYLLKKLLPTPKKQEKNQ